MDDEHLRRPVPSLRRAALLGALQCATETFGRCRFYPWSHPHAVNCKTNFPLNCPIYVKISYKKTMVSGGVVEYCGIWSIWSANHWGKVADPEPHALLLVRGLRQQTHPLHHWLRVGKEPQIGTLPDPTSSVWHFGMASLQKKHLRVVSPFGPRTKWSNLKKS